MGLRGSKIIVDTMQDFYTLPDQGALWNDIDWESTAAKELWGRGPR